MEQTLGKDMYYCKARWENCCPEGCCSIFSDPWFIFAIVTVIVLSIVIFCYFLRMYAKRQREVRRISRIRMQVVDPPLQEIPRCQRSDIVRGSPKVEPDRSGLLPTYDEAIKESR
nr:PREDICTED: uncharacterized protein LOC107398763 [Tribolium castaneum]|eukprot:XP_015839535.1 PREDICTED: uncharacterized protein LOC107398763 [Tribolium castaneum]